MAHIFSGKTFALKKENTLRENVKILRQKGIIPKLVSILVGDNPASVLYVNLKKQAAERIGAVVDIKKFNEEAEVSSLINEIIKLNNNDSVHGIMIQLPLPKNYSVKDRERIINAISIVKDVDGLHAKSKFITPTVKAVLEVLKEASPYINYNKGSVIISVVGAKGFEGSKIFSVLKNMEYEVAPIDKETKNFSETTRNADVVISITGSPGIIGKDEIGEGAVVIDVGSPKGDVRTAEVTGKAAFLSPVPGGVGPVTVTCLLENLIFSAGS